MLKFYFLSFIFVILFTSFVNALFFFSSSISELFFDIFISFPLFYLFSRDRFEFWLSCYFIYLVRASLSLSYSRTISISLFVDQVDSVTIPRRPPRRDHSFATMLSVMNGIPSSLSRLYTVYRLRTMGHNYINDNRVTNFTEYRKLVNF